MTDEDPLEAARRAIARFQPHKTRATLMFAGMFELVYEQIKHQILEQLEQFYTHGLSKDANPDGHGDYRAKIVDRLGRKHVFQSSLMWLIEADALTQEQADKLTLVRGHRNEVVHNLFRYLVDPSVDTDTELLVDAIAILKGLERFWTQTELDIGAFDEYGNLSVDDVTPGWAIVLDMALAAFREGIECDYQAAREEALRRAGMSAPPTA